MCGLKYAKKETNAVISNTDAEILKTVHEAGTHSPPKSMLAEILPVIL